MQVLGYDLSLSLKTPNWVQQAKQEIDLCSNNTVALYEPDHNCKLKNYHYNTDFSSTLYIFLLGLGIPEVQSGSTAPRLPPSRPPLPATSPGVKPKVPKAGVISIPSQEAIINAPVPPPIIPSMYFLYF